MSAKTNYFRLGMFVLVGIILGIAGVIVFGGLQIVPEDMLEVETYMDDSVQGLLSGSKVKMRGVEIGSVDEIGFVASYYDLSEEMNRRYGTWIAVKMSIDPVHFQGISRKEISRKKIEAGLPEVIEDGLRARLTSQGITGGKFIQLEYVDPKRFPPFDPPWEPSTPHLPAAGGVLAEIVSSVDRIVEKLEALDVAKLTQNVDDLVLGITSEVKGADVAGLSEKAQRVLDDVQGLVGGSDVKDSLANVRDITADMTTTISGVNDSLESGDLRATLEDAAATMANLKDLIERIDRTAQRLDRLALSKEPDMETAMVELRLFLKNLRELTDTAKRYPAAVLFGNEPPESKPEEQP